jgi:hypothetical protein
MTEEETVTDLRGEIIGVGDTIAYAVTQGRSANLRIGTVVEIVWSHEKPYYAGSDSTHTVPTKLRVQVDKSAFGSLYSDKPTLIEAGFQRFVKLPPVRKPTISQAEADMVHRCYMCEETGKVKKVLSFNGRLRLYCEEPCYDLIVAAIESGKGLRV